MADLYDFLRIDPEGSPPTSPDDSMLSSFLTAARHKVEQHTRRALCEQRLKLVRSKFPSAYAGFELPRPPLIEVQSVQYYDEANELQTLDASLYYVTDETFCAVIYPTLGIPWPATYCDRADAVLVTYDAGYPPDGSPPTDFAENVPDAIKTAIKLEVQLLYAELSPEKRAAIEQSITRLLASYRVYTF